jgi:hypothetical protein
MFSFLEEIYCSLFGWLFTESYCSDVNTRASFHARVDKNPYSKGGSTKKNRKQKRKHNKTQRL